MDPLKNYIDSTYLDTPLRAGITLEQYDKLAEHHIQEAIDCGCRLVLIRPDHVAQAREMIDRQHSSVRVGTVIGFADGTNTIEEKISEAKDTIKNGADELDFVINYREFLHGRIEYVKDEVIRCTDYVLRKGKTIKWILEAAAMEEEQLAELCELVRDTLVPRYGQEKCGNIFLESSTGYFKTDLRPSGATMDDIHIMLRYGGPLPVKASGGICERETLVKMLRAGVRLIGTSHAKDIIEQEKIDSGQ